MEEIRNMDYLQKALENPVEFVKTRPEKEVIALLEAANNAYRDTGDTILTDDQYDTLYDLMRLRNPNNPFFTKIGSETEPGKKVVLPFHMGGMDKMYSGEEIGKWLTREKIGNEKFVISDKLDGNSGILVKNSKGLYMYSRGNATTGRDLSHLIPFIGIPDLGGDAEIAIRGELIVSKEDFKSVGDKYKNPRNFANSICVAKSHEHTNLLNFVAFDLVSPRMKTMDGFKYLQRLGFQTPQISLVAKKFLNCDTLKSLLGKRRKTAKYEMDGLIITRNGVFEPVKSGNPKHSIAFKVNSFGEETVVKAIDYQITKYGRLMPLVRCEPVIINGASVSNITGNNAKFIVDNRINVGTRLRVILSGEIIPKIVFIDSPEGVVGALPQVDYTWDATHTHVMYSGDSMADTEVVAKRIVSFIKTMNIDALSIGIVKRLIDNGYNTLDSILTISQEALLEIDGFKETLSNKIVKNIRDCLDNPVNLVQLMSASLAFGDGMSAKRLQNVVDTYPNILELDTITVEDIKKIKGFSDKTAQLVVSGLLLFKKFLLEHPYFTIQNPVVSGSKASANLIKEHALANKTIVITGVRDPEVNAFCETISGCKIGNVISGKVDIIVVPSVEYSNKKTTLAESLGITRFTMAEFKEKYISS